MEECIYKNELLRAKTVKKNNLFEREIRLAASEDLLRCPHCLKPVFFKKGEIRDAHFAHKDADTTCLYEQISRYQQNRTSGFKTLKSQLEDHFKKEFVVMKNQKLIKGHFTDFVINEIALDISDQTMRAKQLNYIQNAYNQKQIRNEWIIIDHFRELVDEKDAYYIKRELLNEENKNYVIIYDESKDLFGIYQLDMKEYTYSKTKLKHFFKTNIFFYSFKLDDFGLNDKGVIINGFNESYERWLKERDLEFKLKEYEFNKGIHKCEKEQYIECFNEILNGNEDLKELIVYRLYRITNTSSFYEFIQYYVELKELTENNPFLQYLTDIIEQLLIKSNHENYILK